jgi:hypothetical protein
VNRAVIGNGCVGLACADKLGVEEHGIASSLVLPMQLQDLDTQARSRFPRGLEQCPDKDVYHDIKSGDHVVTSNTV